jgi:hypothetical protein
MDIGGMLLDETTMSRIGKACENSMDIMRSLCAEYLFPPLVHVEKYDTVLYNLRLFVSKEEITINTPSILDKQVLTIHFRTRDLEFRCFYCNRCISGLKCW